MMLLVKSVLMGLAVAAPVGPIAALCIRRTLDHGFMAGVAGGLGTAFADAVYAAVAAGGFAVFAGALERASTAVSFVGGLALIWLAWRGWPRAATLRPAEPAATRGIVSTAVMTFGLTLANPATILSFAAIFAGLGLAGEQQAGTVVLGVFAGSMLWWVFLTGLVAHLRHHLPEGFALWTARASSLMMGGFGIWALSAVWR